MTIAAKASMQNSFYISCCLTSKLRKMASRIEGDSCSMCYTYTLTPMRSLHKHSTVVAQWEPLSNAHATSELQGRSYVGAM